MTKVAKVVSEVKEVKVVKVAKNREILGIKLSKNLPKEVIATIEVIKANKGAVNVPFDTLYNEYLVEMKKISKSKSNLKTRFRRNLYRTNFISKFYSVG